MVHYSVFSRFHVLTGATGPPAQGAATGASPSGSEDATETMTRKNASAARRGRTGSATCSPALRPSTRVQLWAGQGGSDWEGSGVSSARTTMMFRTRYKDTILLLRMSKIYEAFQIHPILKFRKSSNCFAILSN